MRWTVLFGMFLAGCQPLAAPTPTVEPERVEPRRDVEKLDRFFPPLAAQELPTPEVTGRHDQKLKPPPRAGQPAPEEVRAEVLERQGRYLAAWKVQLAAHPDWSPEEHERAREELKRSLLAEVQP